MFTLKSLQGATQGHYSGSWGAIDPAPLGLTVARMMGNEALTRCPLPGHSDARASATFNVVKGLFYCFACQQGMGAAKLAGITGGQVVRVPRAAIIVQEGEGPDSDGWRWLMRRPLAFDNPYLQGRGVTNEAVEYFQIRDAVRGVGWVFKDTEGRPIGAQIRQYEGRPRYLFLGERPPIWPYDHLKGEGTLLVVEGFFGVVNAWQHKHKRAVSTLTAGVSPTATALLSQFNPVALFDNDFPGYVGAGKIVLSAGGNAIVPGAEADEINTLEALKTGKRTNNIRLLAKMSGNRKKFYSSLSKVYAFGPPK